MKRRSSPVPFFTLGIAGLFLLGFFVLIVFGAGIYREAVESENRNNGERALLSYLSTCARTNDAAGAVRVLKEDGTMALAVADETSEYAVRIYRHEGKLVEDYGRLSAPLDPKNASVIGETETFEIEEKTPGAFWVHTDAGTVIFRVRSEGGI